VFFFGDRAFFLLTSWYNYGSFAVLPGAHPDLSAPKGVACHAIGRFSDISAATTLAFCAGYLLVI
jgi:hypothetical protein